MALKTSATITVTGASTATVLSATRQVAHTVYLSAHPSNAAVIWIGDSATSSTGGAERGTVLAASATLTLTSEVAPNDLDLSKIYFASTSSTAKCTISYIEG